MEAGRDEGGAGGWRAVVTPENDDKPRYRKLSWAAHHPKPRLLRVLPSLPFRVPHPPPPSPDVTVALSTPSTLSFHLPARENLRLQWFPEVEDGPRSGTSRRVASGVVLSDL